MLIKTYSGAISGIDALPVEIEVNASGQGEQTMVSIVGLPDAAVRESRERVRSALYACGFKHPDGFTLINLAPADMKKEGSAFDLPIAISLIASAGQAPRDMLEHTVFAGELALDGSLRPVKGILPLAMTARDMDGIQMLVVPEQNAREAAIAASQLKVFPVSNLADAVKVLNGSFLPMAPDAGSLFGNPDWSGVPDFADIKGQVQAKRALEIAAAGGHNVLFIGPPGSGKSLLARAFPGILPPMTENETLETSRIHSVLGLLGPDTPLLRTRPFRSPHHTVSDAGLLGGGTNPQPGEISLAHNGVLFLDELPEFKRNVLEVLRQPLESGIVNVCRAAGSYTFPCRFILLAAMNPCPCGHLGDRRHQCRCRSLQVQQYRARISGPLLDRIDLHVEVAALTEDELLSTRKSESSEQIRARVMRAKEIQINRFICAGITANARMEPAHLTKYCQLDPQNQVLLRHAITEFGLSARAYDRILRVARTIADLAGSENILREHLFEAIGYRSMDRRG